MKAYKDPAPLPIPEIAPFRKIIIENITESVIGLGDYKMLQPHHVEEIEVTNDEYEIWKQCSYVTIQDSIVEP
jgi:hypothetical protein